MPVVKLIDPAREPKWIRAGKPVIHPDLSNGGAVPLTAYSTDQGLALNSVGCSMHDRDGNLWLGTPGGGISRFDGSLFVNYNSSQGLAGNGVWSIVQDSSGHLWFGTGGGVSEFDGRRFTNYDSKDGLAGNSVSYIYRDASGNLWIGTDGNGMSKYDGKQFVNYRSAQGMAGDFVSSICQDQFGNVWISTNGNGVSKFDGKTFTNFKKSDGLASNWVHRVFCDRSGKLWFCTDNGLTKWNGKTFVSYTTADGLVDNGTSCIAEDHSGNLWIGTHAGSSMFDGKSFTNYTAKTWSGSADISNIVFDSAGIIWFSTYGGGLSRFDGNSIKYWSANEGFERAGVWGIFRDRRQKYWFSTRLGAIRYDGRRFETFTTKQGLAGNSIKCFVSDKLGNMWFATDGGVTCYDGERFKSYNKDLGLAGNLVWSLLVDRQGNLWAGTGGEGVSKFDGRSFTNYNTAQGLAGNEVWSIIEDKAGEIWFGTYGGGVSRFDGKVFTTFTVADGLASNKIYSMAEDPLGNIWFGSAGNGITKYDGRHFTTYTTKDGLSDNTVYAIAIDTIHRLIWFGTNHGLSCIKIADAASADLGPPSFKNFSRETGYQINDLDINGIFVDSDGKLWGGCGDKLIHFDYMATHRPSTPPDIHLLKVRVNGANLCWNAIAPDAGVAKKPDSLTVLNEMVGTFGRPLSPDELDSMRRKFKGVRFDGISGFFPIPANLILPYNDNAIDVEWSANEFLLPTQVRYRYWLTGYNKDWSSPERTTRISFGNIPEGIHVLKLMAIGPGGGTSEVQFGFRVLPPWYRRWWIYVMEVLLPAAAIWLLFRWRTRTLKQEKIKLEKKVEKRTEQLREKEIDLRQAFNELKDAQAQIIQLEKLSAQMNPHFVFNALNTIQSFIYGNDKKSATKYLGKFSDLMRKVLDNSTKSKVALASEIELLGLYLDLERSRFGEEFDARIEIEPDLNLEEIEVPPMLIQPYVENAIIHGLLHKPGEKRLVTQVCRSPVNAGKIGIRITDNGIGRVKSQEINRSRVDHNSFATKANDKRIEIFNNYHKTSISISIEDLYYRDGTPAGTSIQISVPVEPAAV